MRNKIVLNSPRLQKIKKGRNKVLRKKIAFFVLFLFIIFIAFVFISRWQKLNINNIQITGNKVIESKTLEEIVKKDISGYYLWVIPKTNFIFYPKNQIKKELSVKFKRIKDISISTENLNTLKVDLTERTALYTYCGANLDAELFSQEKCYFLDKEGYIFDEAPFFSGEIYTKFYGTTDINSENNPSDSYFFKTDFQKLISLKETLGKMGIKSVIFYLQDDGNVNVYLTSKSQQLGPKIILKLDSDFDKAIENLQSILATEPLQTDFKTKYNSLLYIDLRFGNKVYYKFK